MKRLALTANLLTNKSNAIRKHSSKGNGEDKVLPLKSLPLQDRVKKTLEEKGYKVKEGHANFILQCHFCTRDERFLYVNKESGMNEP